MKNVGSDVGRAVGAGVGVDVGTADGTAVNIVGADVSSSRRAPSRRPLDRRAFGPLRGGALPHDHRAEEQAPPGDHHERRQPPPPRFGMNYGSPLLDLLWAAVHAGFQASQRREGQYHTYRASDDRLQEAV